MNKFSLSRAVAGVSVILLLAGAAPPRWLGKSARAEVAGPEPDPRPQYFMAGGGEYAEAQQLLRARKWDEAVILLRSALRGNPASAAIAGDLARALAFAGRREEALNILGQILARQKSVAQAHQRDPLIRRLRVLSRLFLTNATFQIHQDGLNLMQERKYRPAREHFEKALEQEPTNVEILARLGQCMVLDGDFDSAAERLRLAERLDPYEPEIRLWLGRALDERGEASDALDELRSAHKDLPGGEAAAVWYAEALFRAGERSTALQVLEENLKREPDHVKALVTLSRLRLEMALPHDAQAAWQARKELQLALSRLKPYLSSPVFGADPIDPEGDLEIDLRENEPDLRKEIQKIFAEAESRIDGALAPES